MWLYHIATAVTVAVMGTAVVTLALVLWTVRILGAFAPFILMGVIAYYTMLWIV